jgi:hypothetical protein
MSRLYGGRSGLIPASTHALMGEPYRDKPEATACRCFGGLATCAIAGKGTYHAPHLVRQYPHAQY